MGVRFFLIGNDVCFSVRDNIINPEHWAASLLLTPLYIFNDSKTKALSSTFRTL